MKTYELLNQIKDLCLYSDTGTSRDAMILQRLNMVQSNLYNTPHFWKGLEGVQDLYTTELLTLNVAPAQAWAVGATITGATSLKTCVVVDVLSTTTYNVKDRSGTFTLGEVLSDGTYTADQGVLYPTFTQNAHSLVPSDVGVIFDMRQMTTSPYSKLTYLHPHLFHEIVPQPTSYTSGNPTYYTWWGGKIWWYPIPDDTYTITMYYYKKPTDMKTYSAVGTCAVSTHHVTGTSTYFSNNGNVDTNMYFTMTGDILSNGLYPWSKVQTVTDNTGIVLATNYAGASTTTAAYAFSSEPTFPSEFDAYFIYSAALMELGRMREASQTVGWLKAQLSDIMPGLIRNQTYIPDWNPTLQNFTQGGIILGADYAKFPFVQGNP